MDGIDIQRIEETYVPERGAIGLLSNTELPEDVAEQLVTCNLSRDLTKPVQHVGNWPTGYGGSIGECGSTPEF